MNSVAIVYCGLIRDPALLLLAFEPAFILRQQGRVQRIVVSTWCGEADRLPGGSSTLRKLGVELIETEFPARLAVPGNVFQQMLAMERALDCIEDDTLCLKTRTDVLFTDVAALESILQQNLTLGPQRLPGDSNPVFSERVWVPGFQPAYPFYFCDQVFFGRTRDLRKLNNFDLFTEAHHISSRPHEVTPHHHSGAAAEIRRYLMPFVTAFDLLREYQFVWPKHCFGDVTPWFRPNRSTI